MKEALASFISHLSDHWVWLTGLLLMIEPLLDNLVPNYRTQADKVISRKIRTRMSWSLAIGAAFIACFLSFQDEFQEADKANTARNTAEAERDEVRRQLSMASPSGQQNTIDQLSAELRSARTEIDVLKQRDEARKKVRHLTSDDKQNLVRVFSPLAAEFSVLKISAPGDGEAQGYAKEFAALFNQLERRECGEEWQVWYFN